MPDPTPAAELRAAAERLRYLLHEDGMPEPVRASWTQLPYPAKQGVVTVPGEERPVLMAFWGGVSEYVTAMQPAVGTALADWLDHASTRYDPAVDIQVTDRSHELPLAVARAINTTEEQPR